MAKSLTLEDVVDSAKTKIKNGLKSALTYGIGIPAGLGFGVILALGYLYVRKESRSPGGRRRLLKLYPFAAELLNAVSSNYQDSPPFENVELDDLDNCLLLGLDAKITPHGEVRFIEVNGWRSGMDGFAKAAVPFEPYMPSDGWKGEIVLPEETKNPCESALESYLQHYGSLQLNYVAGVLLNRKYWSWLLLWERAVEDDDGRGTTEVDLRWLESYLRELVANQEWIPEEEKEKIAVHPNWARRYGGLVERIERAQEVFDDKALADSYFESCRKFKAESHDLSEGGIEALLADNPPEYAVMKPRKGLRGEGLEVLRTDELWEMTEYRPDYLIESFVASKPILCEETGEMHDGCMRYIVLVEESKEGELALKHFGGYWRLAPKPMSKIPHLDAMRANLSQKAYPQRAAREDLMAVGEAVEEFLPVFYRDLKADMEK